MSTHDSDSGQPPQRARRLVLRKIGDPSAPPAPLPPPRAPLPSLSSLPSTTRSENSAAALMVPATRPGPGVRRRGLDAAPSVPAMPRSSSSPPAPPGAPPADFSAVPAPAPLPSFASFGSTAGGTPLPNRTRPSLPPVVANLAAGQAHVVPPIAPPATSARKAGLVGATLGLTLVAMFVIGARIAYRLTPQPLTEAASATSTTASAASAATPAAAPSSAMPSQGVPLVLAQSLPPADSAPAAVPPPRRRPPAPRPAAGPAKAAAQPAEPPAEGASATAPTASAAPSSSAGSTAPADSATSLVPVIPSSAPPEVDPLVKAVLEDNK